MPSKLPEYVVVVMRSCGTTWSYGLYTRDDGSYELSAVIPGDAKGPEPAALERALEKKLKGKSGARRKAVFETAPNTKRNKPKP